MRFIRLALALTIIIQAIATSEILFAIVGGFLAFQAVFNYGCCGTSGCDIGHTRSKLESVDQTSDVNTFEEIK